MTDYETQPPSKPIVKLQQTAQHMAKQVKKLHTAKVKRTQAKQSERREIVIDRNVQCSKCSIFNQSTAKITRYSMS